MESEKSESFAFPFSPFPQFVLMQFEYLNFNLLCAPLRLLRVICGKTA